MKIKFGDQFFIIKFEPEAVLFDIDREIVLENQRMLTFYYTTNEVRDYQYFVKEGDRYFYMRVGKSGLKIKKME